jgi:hypothetical protein
LEKKQEEKTSSKKIWEAGEYFIDPIMKEQLDGIKRRVFKKDRDVVIVVDGREGTGKSVLTSQLAKYCDPSYNLDNVHFNFDTFVEDLTDNVGNVVHLDEGLHATDSRASMSMVNRTVRAVFSEMRQNRHFVFITLPSIFDMDKNIALWRTDALIHVYFDEDDNRGRYIIFPYNKKKQLILKGKRFYNYNLVKSPFPALRFRDQWVFDSEEYSIKKRDAFRDRGGKKEGNYNARIQLEMIKMLKEKAGMNFSDVCKKIGISRSNVTYWRKSLGI